MTRSALARPLAATKGGLTNASAWPEMTVGWQFRSPFGSRIDASLSRTSSEAHCRRVVGVRSDDLSRDLAFHELSLRLGQILLGTRGLATEISRRSSSGSHSRSKRMLKRTPPRINDRISTWNHRTYRKKELRGGFSRRMAFNRVWSAFWRALNPARHSHSGVIRKPNDQRSVRCSGNVCPSTIISSTVILV